jgi:hypothetical protein
MLFQKSIENITLNKNKRKNMPRQKHSKITKKRVVGCVLSKTGHWIANGVRVAHHLPAAAALHD